MYIGDPNKRKDLTKKAVREQSRFSLFFTVVRVRNFNLMWLNLLYSLFLLPTFVIVYFAFYHYAMGGTEGINEMTFQDVVSYIYMLFPCMLIAVPGTLGFTNVLHRWANDEHAWISDFWTGIKKNWKQGLIVTVINYLVLVFLIYCIWFWLMLGKNTSDDPSMNTFYSMGQYVAFFLVGCLFVYFAIHMYVFPMMIRYKLTVKEIYKYSATLAFKDFFGTIALLFFTIGITYIVLVTPYMFYVVPVVMLVFVYLVIYVRLGKNFNRYVFLDVKDY